MKVRRLCGAQIIEAQAEQKESAEVPTHFNKGFGFRSGVLPSRPT